MFSTLATLVLLSFLLLMGVVLLLWSLISFGTGPKAVSMPWGRARPERADAANPFIRKPDNRKEVSSELVPDHISRGQIRTVKKPVSDVTLAEIKAITEEKVDNSVKTTTYEQMVKRAKSPSRTSTPVPPSRIQHTQAQVNNDQLRGAHAKKTLVDQPVPEVLKEELPKPDSQKEKANDVPAFIQINDLKSFPPLPPAPLRPDVTHSSKDTPVAKLPNKLPDKPIVEETPVPEKKLWPAPLAPMVPKPAVQDAAKTIVPQPYKPAETNLKPEAVPKVQSRDIAKQDPFEKFSKDKKDDTLF